MGEAVDHGPGEDWHALDQRMASHTGRRDWPGAAPFVGAIAFLGAWIYANWGELTGSEATIAINVPPSWWLLMAVMMLAFWGGLAWLIVTLIRHPGSTHHPSAPLAKPSSDHSDPEDILHDRLARGEIDIDEYHQRIDALRAKRTELPEP